MNNKQCPFVICERKDTAFYLSSKKIYCFFQKKYAAKKKRNIHTKFNPNTER